MKIVMTLLVRDEADILEDQIAYHLAAGVDFVVATDHRSVDGTTEILEDYASRGRLHLFHEEGERIQQSVWVTRMARLAATEYAADWIVNSDADGFWWPRGPTLKDVLARVPERYGVVHGLQQNFVPVAGKGPFAERMTVRLVPAAPINDSGTPFRPASQVAHRAHRDIQVVQGNHDIRGVPLAAMRTSPLLEILHFPFRSREQIARKHQNTLAAWQRNFRGDLARVRSLLEQGRDDAFWERVLVDDAQLARGLENGILVEDTRVRDALRELRSESVESPRWLGALECAPSLAENVSLAVQSDILVEANAVRVRRWLDAVDSRLHALEGTT